jgi:3-methyladenine DNA glycosylase AlkD
MAFYRAGVLGDGPEIIAQLLGDKEDLLHKACGWMLREIYWRVDKQFVESFIIDHYDEMSRTTLRYAIERMPEPQRKRFLKGGF